MFFGEGGSFLEHTAGHSFKGEVGDAPEQAVGIFPDSVISVLGEGRLVAADETEVMVDKGLDFISREGQEVIFQGDALIERDEHRSGEAVREMGLSGEDEQSGVRGIHVEIGEDLEFGKVFVF